MFKTAATKIAHNTTIPALAGKSDLRPLQDLITAEKTVLMSYVGLQKLRVDLVKAGDALRIWGQGEGDDLGDILAASSTILTYFATALSTYSSLHHTVRDSMKSVRTREEALDDLRRRRRRIGANAEAAEKRLNKMSPEHKNLNTQMDLLNRLREEMRVLDAEILREEAELGDYKRKCTKDWMGFKFGGLVECCEKGAIVGDIGRQIIQSIPEDTTQPGVPRAYYNAHGHVGDLVVVAQRVVSQVVFSAKPVGRNTEPIFQPPTSQEPPAQEPFLPTPSLGSELTLGVTMYNPPPGPPPVNKRVSVDELGMQASSTHAPPQFSSLPTNREYDPTPVSPSVRPAQLSMPYDSGVARSEENQSLMASIADALSQSHRGFSLEGTPAPDEPVPKYESIAGGLMTSTQSEPHVSVANGHAGPAEERAGFWPKRAMRRSTSPPSLPPGAAPAAIRAWDDRMGQGEDGAHSDHPASSSEHVPSQRPTSSLGQVGEEEDESVYEREKQSFREDGEGDAGVDGKHQKGDVSLSEGIGEASGGATATINDQQGMTPIQGSVSPGVASHPTLLSRAGSQWRIPRVPPPSIDPDVVEAPRSPAQDRRRTYSPTKAAQEEEDETMTSESADNRARNEATAREVSRAMDALEFSAVAPPSMTPSGYAMQRGPLPGHGPSLSMQGQAATLRPRVSPHLRSSSSTMPYGSAPSSPITSPNPPFANRGRAPSPMMDARPLLEHRHTSNESFSGGLHAQTPMAPAPGGDGWAPTASSTSLKYRSPPPEYPRPTPPFSSSFMARSTSSLNSAGGGTSPVSGPRTISAAAFRRQQARSPSGAEIGPADTSPLTFRRPSGSQGTGLPQALMAGTVGTSKARLSVVNPDPRASDEEEGDEEFDYIEAYSRDSSGYAMGRYVSDVEKS